MLITTIRTIHKSIFEHKYRYFRDTSPIFNPNSPIALSICRKFLHNTPIVLSNVSRNELYLTLISRSRVPVFLSLPEFSQDLARPYSV